MRLSLYYCSLSSVCTVELFFGSISQNIFHITFQRRQIFFFMEFLAFSLCLLLKKKWVQNSSATLFHSKYTAAKNQKYSNTVQNKTKIMFSVV